MCVTSSEPPRISLSRYSRQFVEVEVEHVHGQHVYHCIFVYTHVLRLPKPCDDIVRRYCRRFVEVEHVHGQHFCRLIFSRAYVLPPPNLDDEIVRRYRRQFVEVEHVQVQHVYFMILPIRDVVKYPACELFRVDPVRNARLDAFLERTRRNKQETPPTSSASTSASLPIYVQM